MSTVIKWRIAIAWALLFLLNTTASSFIIAFGGIADPSKLTAWQIAIIIAGWIMSLTGTLMAFLSKAARALPGDGSAPELPNGGTQFLTKADQPQTH